MEREGIWYHVVGPAGDLPDQGFKIHLSATSRTAEDLLRRALPLCVDAGVAFKVLVDAFIVDFTNSKNYSRASSGKFITIYPPTVEACGALLDRLAAATGDLAGPHVLSDRPYRDSKVVFYRYGGFRPRFQMNLFGEKMAMIAAPDGGVMPDPRAPSFRLPPRSRIPSPPPISSCRPRSSSTTATRSTAPSASPTRAASTARRTG